MVEEMDEAGRLATLNDYDLLDTAAEPAFDAFVAQASERLGSPIAMVSLIDRHRQFFKAQLGVSGNETGIEGSFCKVAIEAEELLIVPDATKDPRFADSQFVTAEPHIRFYAGAPLTVANGARLGTLCVIDTAPRDGLSPEEEDALKLLARRTVAAIEMRRDLLGSHDRGAWVAEAARLLEQAAVALEQVGDPVALALLEGAIDRVDTVAAGG